MIKIVRAIEVRKDEPTNREVFWLDISDVSNYQLKVYDMEDWRVIMDSTKISIPIIDSLTSVSTQSALSANQGKVLASKIEELNNKTTFGNLKVILPEYTVYDAEQTYNIKINVVVTTGSYSSTGDHLFYINGQQINPVFEGFILKNASVDNNVFEIKAVHKKTRIALIETVTLDFGYHSYWSTIKPGTEITDASLDTFQKQLTLKEDILFSSRVNNDLICFIAPNEYGTVQSIVDGNGLEVMQEYTLETKTLRGRNYYIYTSRDPLNGIKSVVQKYKYSIV